MGDFGRQNSLLQANIVNLLQFLFQQYAWSELEVLVFPKKECFYRVKNGQILPHKVDLTEEIRVNLTLCARKAQ